MELKHGQGMTIDLNLLLRAYRHGIFPMADSREENTAYWVEPKKRAIIPLNALKISKSLAKTIKQDRFRVTSDQAFADVIRMCAEAQDDRQETWINSSIEQAFLTLHEMGQAHSVECWLDDKLVGGLYGLAMGRAFFGESMFSRATDASKTALVWLVARMRMGGFQLLDCQFMTNHLASLGAIEISQKAYLALLEDAVAGCDDLPDPLGFHHSSTTASPPASSTTSSSSTSSGDWAALDTFSSSLPGSLGGPSSSPGKLILHSFTQTS
jgi:leucyl/phenylalanyl-tRNA---protein transferase